jgi:hypothetical protein
MGEEMQGGTGNRSGGPIDMFRTHEEAAYRVPAAPLLAALRDPRIIIFLVAWFGLNLLFGIGVPSLPGIEQSVAWQAHIGGFLAGLTLFALFDRVPPGRLVGRGADGKARQGASVGLSCDGNTAIVGGPADHMGFGAAIGAACRRRGPRLPLELLVKRQTSETANFFGFSDNLRQVTGALVTLNARSANCAKPWGSISPEK